MKIAILGAGFDPPHIGHYIIATTVLDKLALDAVWLMPLYKHPFHKDLSPVKHRLTMAKALENSHITVSEFEIKQRKISYSFETLEKLSSEYPNFSFRWVMGSDQLPTITKWRKWNSLFEKYHPIIYPRPGTHEQFSYQLGIAHELQERYKTITIFNPNEVLMTNISSTTLRHRLRNNLSITHLVPKAVEEYIAKNKLYQ